MVRIDWNLGRGGTKKVPGTRYCTSGKPPVLKVNRTEPYRAVPCSGKAPLVPIEHCLNATAYLSIVADNVLPLYDYSVPPSSDGYFQQDNAPCHKAQIISDWFLEHDNEFTILKWPPQSPDLNPICTNCVMLSCQYGPKPQECFQHLVESMP